MNTSRDEVIADVQANPISRIGVATMSGSVVSATVSNRQLDKSGLGFLPDLLGVASPKDVID
jgi:hypothetical protein